MVTNSTSLGRSGLQDWLVQRITAVVMALYIIFQLIYWGFQPELNFTAWHALFEHLAMRLFTLLFLVALALHAWVGLWVVLTDYIKCTVLRIGLQMIVIIANFVYFVWGVHILWGINA